jgi:hypothetical protein
MMNPPPCWWIARQPEPGLTQAETNRSGEGGNAVRAPHVILTSVELFLLVTLASGGVASEPASPDGPASSGVALAAIQEIDKRVQVQAERIADLEA